MSSYLQLEDNTKRVLNVAIIEHLKEKGVNKNEKDTVSVRYSIVYCATVKPYSISKSLCPCLHQLDRGCL